MHIQKFPRDILNILLISQLVQYIWSMLMGNSYFHIRTNHKAWMCIYTFHAYSFKYKISSIKMNTWLVTFLRDLLSRILSLSIRAGFLASITNGFITTSEESSFHDNLWKGIINLFKRLTPPLLFVHISPIVTASNTTHTPTHIITHRQTISWKEKIDKRFKKMQMR